MKKRKISFYIEPLAPAGLFLLIFAVESLTRAAVISSVIVHEVSHYIAARLCGASLLGIRITPCGISLLFTSPKTYGEETKVAFCGPFSSFLYAFTGYIYGGDFGMKVFLFSAFLGAMNMLPLPSFDGYRIVCGIISPILGADITERILYAISMACLFLVWIISVYILFYSGANFVLLFFCAYIFAFAVIKKDCIRGDKMIQ
ncbi:MAG: hypothetical protein ACI4QR_06270 [Eubacteriales bacterium]